MHAQKHIINRCRLLHMHLQFTYNTACMYMIAWAFIKEGWTSRYLASCVVRKNLCPGITVRLATPLAKPINVLKLLVLLSCHFIWINNMHACCLSTSASETSFMLLSSNKIHPTEVRT